MQQAFAVNFGFAAEGDVAGAAFLDDGDGDAAGADGAFLAGDCAGGDLVVAAAGAC
jgi:hypothetical protein